jgi:hypothetical protein
MRGSEPTDRRQSGQAACEATWQTTTTTGSALVERSTVPMSGRSNLGHPVPVAHPLATIGGANDQVLDGVRWSFRLLGRWRVDKKTTGHLCP